MVRRTYFFVNKHRKAKSPQSARKYAGDLLAGKIRPPPGGKEMMDRMEVMTMPPVVTPDQRQGGELARREIVRYVEHGMTVTQARRRCPAPMHRSTVYRLLKRVKQEGEHAFAERRHGHPTK